MYNYSKVLCHVHDLMRHSYWSRRKLLKHQEKQLRKILKYAYDYVPFYHYKFKKLKINPRNIATLEDLSKLPIIRKDEMRKNPDAVISRQFDKKNLRTLSTSGSTGHPLRVFVSKDEDMFRKAKHLRANISCHQKPMDRWVTITSPTHFGEVGRFQRILGFFAPRFVSVFDDTDAQILTVERLRPHVIDGYSSSLVLLAKGIQNREVKTIRPKMVFGGAELIDDPSRQFIEEVLGAPFYDQYATVELERMAWQCPEKSEYHIDADAIILEFVEGDCEVSPGETGEIVCTSLFSYAMPFIRYAIGDAGVPSYDDCPCGRKLPLMKIIEGRKNSFLRLPGGRLLSPRTFTIAMNTFDLISHVDQFRVSQKRKDLLEVQIKKKDDLVDEKVMENTLVSHLERMLAIKTSDLVIDVKFVEGITLKRNGKFNIVSSEL